MLEAGGIDTTGHEMLQQQVINSFKHIIKLKNNADSAEMPDNESKVVHDVLYDVASTEGFSRKEATPNPVTMAMHSSDASPLTILERTPRPGKTSFVQKIVQWWKHLIH
ncbi:hypothetical protein ECE50_013410 [Chitinophaga sp. Mgbs1]|uniref:Uncharacterized protein n=1 Tax=Chitinophaga solisilvae TaxID=1233460 RepID=A0A3S1JFZ1_9BACT|nr:hypothetical protein [Chitinophaga solisilvae]